MAADETVDQLFAEYVLAHRAGDVDPVPFLDRAPPAGQDPLAELIDAYLVSAPGREWDPAAFQGSAAERLVDPVTRTLCGVSGTWPVLLPSLRNRARIKRAQLVERLAEGLGHPGRTEDVEQYYHDMEYGTLPSEGVSTRVLEVLSGILGTGSETLRKAGELIGGGEFEGGGPVFARQPSFGPDPGDAGQREQSGQPDQPGQFGHPADRAEGVEARSGGDPEALEIEQLFTGGDG